MDGGRILRALLAFRFNYLKATTIAAMVGKIIAALFIVYGLVTMNFMLSIIGLFIILFAQAEESYLQLKQLVKGLYLKDMVMYDYNSLDATQRVNEAASVLEHNHSKYFIVMDKGMPVGTINRMEIMKAIAEQQYDQKVASLMKNNVVSLQGDADAESALQTLSSNEEKLFPVLDNGKFIGVINFQHLIEYLLLHKTHSKDFAKTKSLVQLV